MKILFLLALLLMLPVFSGELLLMTEEYPPYNYTGKENGKEETIGFAVDVVKRLQKIVGDNSLIKMMVWREALEKLETTPNSAVFAIAKNPIREKKFNLLGPIGQGNYIFYAKAGNDIVINHLDDAKKYRVGVYKNDICEQFLRSKGFTNLLVAETDSFNLERLLDGQIDLWLVGDLKAGFVSREKGVAFDKINGTYTAFVTSLYIAFNKATDKKVYQRWQEALDKIREDGTIDKIRQEWLDKLTEKLEVVK